MPPEQPLSMNDTIRDWVIEDAQTPERDRIHIPSSRPAIRHYQEAAIAEPRSALPEEEQTSVRLEIPPHFWQEQRRGWRSNSCGDCQTASQRCVYHVRIVYYRSNALRDEHREIELVSLSILIASDEEGWSMELPTLPNWVRELSLLLVIHGNTAESIGSFFRCRRCQNFTTQLNGARGLCSTCLRTHRVCTSCDEICPEENVSLDARNHAMCGRCSRDFFICSTCGFWTHREDAAAIEIGGRAACRRCEQRGSRHIAPYGTMPPLHFLAKEGDDPSQRSTLYLGIELETDRYPDSKSRSEAGDILGKRDPNHELYWLTSDSTLNNGFEIISQPATLEYHKSEFPWEEITSVIVAHEGHSSSTDTCGLHIHFNKAFFGGDEDAVDLVTMKLLYLIEHFWTKWVKFSRRTQEQLNHYANRYNTGFKDMPLDKVKELKWNAGRYRAVNIGNDKGTIEIRLFQGTLDVNIIYACLELVDFLTRYCRDTSATDIYGLSWHKLVRVISKVKYPYLVAYLEKRELKRGKKKEGGKADNVLDNL